MFRFALTATLACGLSGCMTPSGGEQTTGLEDKRVVLPSPDPDGGPLVFEFYADGKGLFALNEVADRGQEPLTWRILDDELCIEVGGLSEDCVPVAIQGNRISLEFGSETNVGTITPL